MIEQLRSALLDRGGEFGFRSESLVIEPVLNWGGFVNQSYRVSDGGVSRFVKIATAEETRGGLERWRMFATVLESRYHAPRMVGWLDMPRSDHAGAVFEWVEGATPERVEDAPVDAILRVIGGLHDDTDLARELTAAGDPVASCADAYRGAYHRRFEEDLAFIWADPPPFVDAARLDWMREEAAGLEAEVAGLEAFSRPAAQPTHGDLWVNNLLLAAAEGWYVVDWDGLGLGDPVMDWAMLFGPTRSSVSQADASRLGRSLGLDADQQGRLRVYARASLLDWIIDPLADWVQAGSEPHFGPEVRESNERVHTEALRAYRAAYG